MATARGASVGLVALASLPLVVEPDSVREWTSGATRLASKPKNLNMSQMVRFQLQLLLWIPVLRFWEPQLTVPVT